MSGNTVNRHLYFGAPAQLPATIRHDRHSFVTARGYIHQVSVFRTPPGTVRSEPGAGRGRFLPGNSGRDLFPSRMNPSGSALAETGNYGKQQNANRCVASRRNAGCGRTWKSYRGV
eukprot:TRINITY_DN23225_c0_g1_i3.p2 TRINITY_DN23225_c0_g1~~TRINITY_DN23225_c0_g1_i3.p2  ORF type:complete len:116 (-),score=15.48 TRINITY_DN23225_c0_g1_i3:189-536(-)